MDTIKNEWLVKILVPDDNNGYGYGSGIIVSEEGHVLTCFHNIHTKQSVPNRCTISSVRLLTELGWSDIKNIEENIKHVTPSTPAHFAKLHDLGLLTIPKTAVKDMLLPTFVDHKVKEGEELYVLAYHSMYPETNYVFKRPAKVITPCVSDRNLGEYFKLSIRGIKGMSGGGIFTSQGQLIGIMKRIDTETQHEILASPIYPHIIETWVPIATKNYEISNLLDNGRKENKKTRFSIPQQSQSRQRKKIDPNIIASYDLKDLTKEFTGKIPSHAKGTFAFAINGNKLILEKYIIKRIKNELKEKTKRECMEPIQIPLYLGEATNGITTIKTKLAKHCNKQTIGEIIDEKMIADVLIIIWNYGILPNELKPIVNDFWQDINAQLSRKLNNTRCRCCFIIVWANISPDRNLAHEKDDYFLTLPLPNKLDIEELKGWFWEELTKLNFQEELITCHFDDLEAPAGHLEGTYHALENIFCKLKGG